MYSMLLFAFLILKYNETGWSSGGERLRHVVKYVPQSSWATQVSGMFVMNWHGIMRNNGLASWRPADTSLSWLHNTQRIRKPQTEIHSQANGLELESKQGISYPG